MTQRTFEFRKLDELRKNDENLFRMAVDCLFSIGYLNMTDKMVIGILDDINNYIDANEVSSEELIKLFTIVCVLKTASKICDIPLYILLDYIAENGWRA